MASHEDRIERALGVLAGTVCATTVFVVSFFLLFGSELPPGLPAVFVTVTVILALIPIGIAGIRLALGVNSAREHGVGEVAVSRVVTSSIIWALGANLILSALGAVASMGMLLGAVLPYVFISSALLVPVAAALGGGFAKLVVSVFRPAA